MLVDLKVLDGTHLTPLTQNIILEPARELNIKIPDPMNTRAQVRQNFLETVDQVKKTLITYYLCFLQSIFEVLVV